MHERSPTFRRRPSIVYVDIDSIVWLLYLEHVPFVKCIFYDTLHYSIAAFLDYLQLST